jgi:hypothetical protein
MPRHGNPTLAVDCALAAIRLEPVRESAHRALMTAHLTAGNVSEALEQFDTYHRILDAELSVDPSRRCSPSRVRSAERHGPGTCHSTRPVDLTAGDRRDDCPRARAARPGSGGARVAGGAAAEGHDTFGDPGTGEDLGRSREQVDDVDAASEDLRIGERRRRHRLGHRPARIFGFGSVTRGGTASPSLALTLPREGPDVDLGCLRCVHELRFRSHVIDLAALISGSVVAAIIGAVVSTWLTRRKSREEELARVRVMLAEAFQAVAEYKEFPYAIRRRRRDAPSEKRVRLSEELRKVQGRLTFFEEWTRIEDKTVGDRYRSLVKQLRRIAGAACNEAWSTPPITEDAQMNIAREEVDLSALATYEGDYTEAARAYVEGFMKTRRRKKR